ncbi:MAG TPA: fumarylacetoacetase [Rhodoferax sp.]|jgi:fumarylacetoacetase|nr:fumarylacetoacetase [Rhodoferax sp.]
MTALNHTHAPDARSWVASANAVGTDFPIQNLPFAIFKRRGSAEAMRGGIAIGDQVLDLQALASSGCLAGHALAHSAAEAASHSTLNALMALGPTAWSALRHAVFDLLASGASAEVQEQVQACLIPQADVEYGLPAHIGDYTDFYTSIYHATNVGKLFRPDNPLLPNYCWVPIGYHGRSSSVQVSGQPIHRPRGQVMAAGQTVPQLAPCARLDWELELGVFMGPGNAPGRAIPLDAAPDHVFGMCLLNDWSARDIQAWEYQPLGPFLSKNFGTSISPWVVTMEALAPYHCAMERPDGKQDDVDYLRSENNRNRGALDIQLRIGLTSDTMRAASQPVHWVCQTSYRHAYWTLAQMVAHHTVNGCNLQPGDLLGTGTLSGPTLDQAGALLELTQGGKVPLTLPDGQTRTFLQDGDEVTLQGWCEKPGAARIGFGECQARVLPATPTQT